MVAGKSPEWLPPGLTEKVKYKNGRKIKYYYNVAMGTKYHSKKDVLSCVMADNGHLGTPQTTNGDDNRLSSDNKVEAELAKTNDSPEWLPNGWKMEEKTRKSGFREGATYKVYTELSSGSKFYSRPAVTRYMKTVKHANTKNEQNKVDNVDEPLPNTSPPCISMTNADHVPGKKQKASSSKTVAIESSAVDDLPPGWIKEIKTSKSGNRIRKDPFYTDPVSGYMFRSKLDALRYLQTNDIRSCASRPKKRELDDSKLIMEEIPSPSPANETSSEHKRQLFPDEELNGGESSGTKSQAQTTTKTQDNDEPDSVKVTSVGVEENSNKIVEIENNTEPVDEVSKYLTESGMNKRTDGTSADLRKSKKRRDSSLPSRTSKRLAGGEPEIVSNSVLNERALRSATRRSSGIKVNIFPSFPIEASATTSQPSEIEPAKEDPKHETVQVLELPNHVAIPEEKVIKEQPDDSKRSQESEQPDDTKRLQESEQPDDNKRSLESEQPDDNRRSQASEQPDDNKRPLESKQPDDDKRSHESQLCYDFGDSWSDPLEFALKTLRGEIPIDDTLAFPGGFDEQLSSPYNQTLRPLQPDDDLSIPYNQMYGPSQTDAPIIFHNEFVPPSESSKQKSPVNQFAPNSSSVPALGNLWSGFNSQSSTDATKQDCPTKFNP